MDRPFTYELGCCSCSKRFKTLVAVRKHVEKKHTGENLSLQSIRFWDKEQCAIPVPVIKLLDRRSTDYKQGYLPWLAGMTEQINASLHPCLRGRWVTISFPQVPARFFGHLASHLGCQVNSMRQIPHKKPPFYKKTTKKVSYKIFSLNPFVEALREQDIVQFKGSLMCSGDDEVGNIESSNPRDELRAAKSRSFWSTTQRDKRPDYKGYLEVGTGEGRNTREIEFIWWPELFSSTSNGKLSIRFFLKKVYL